MDPIKTLIRKYHQIIKIKKKFRTMTVIHKIIKRKL